MLKAILNGLGAVGNVLDLPGSSVRDVLAGQNPFDQYLTPLHDQNRTSGRDLLQTYGIVGQDNNWGNFAGGMAAEMLLDPTNLVGGGFLRNTLKGIGAAKKANVAIDAANQLARQHPAMISPSVMGRDMAGEVQVPQQGIRGYLTNSMIEPIPGRSITPEDLPSGSDANSTTWYHGGPKEIETPSTVYSNDNSLVGRGFYMTDDHNIAGTYKKSRGVLHEVKTDVRKTLNMERTLPSDAADVIRRNVWPEFQDVVEESIRSGDSGLETWKKLTDEVSAYSQGDGVPASEFTEMFMGIEQELKRSGYDALTHIGGVHAGKGKKQHKVMVLLDPSEEYIDYGRQKSVKSIRPLNRLMLGNEQMTVPRKEIVSNLERVNPELPRRPVPKTPRGLIGALVMQNILRQQRERQNGR